MFFERISYMYHFPFAPTGEPSVGDGLIWNGTVWVPGPTGSTVRSGAIDPQVVSLGPSEEVLTGSVLNFPYVADRAVIINCVLYNYTDDAAAQTIIERFQAAWEYDPVGDPGVYAPWYEPPDFVWLAAGGEGTSYAPPYVLQYTSPLMGTLAPPTPVESINFAISGIVDAGDGAECEGHVWAVMV